MALLIGMALSAMPLATLQPTASATSVQVVELETRAEALERKRRDRDYWAPQCRKLYAGRNQLADTIEKQRLYPEKLAQLAHHFEDGLDGCRRKPEFATVLRDHAAGSGPVPNSSREEVETLVNRLKSKPETTGRALHLRRGLWLRGDYWGPDTDLAWTNAERDAFLDRSDVWTWLSANFGKNYATRKHFLGRLFAPASTRFNPSHGINIALSPTVSVIDADHMVEAARLLLEGKHVPQDIPRAEATLLALVDYHDPARLLMVDLVAPRLASLDTEIRDGAVSLLARIAAGTTYASGTKGSAAAQKLLVPYHVAGLQSTDPKLADIALWALSSLAEAKAPGAYEAAIKGLQRRADRKTFDDRLTSLQILGRLSRAGYPQATVQFEQAITRLEQLVVIDNPEKIVSNVRLFLTGDDYPPSAARNEEEGTVSGKILIGPDGRVLSTYITKSASPALDAVVEKTALRRIRVNDPKYAGQFIMLNLPDIQFVLNECITDRKPPVAEHGVLQIVSYTCPQPNLDVPTPVTVVGS